MNEVLKSISSYMVNSTRGTSGADLIKEAGGGIVAVEIEYRLGLFGFLPGSATKAKGALNAGLREHVSQISE